MPNKAPSYSIDASAIIELKNIYPIDIKYFEYIWEFIGNIADQGRLFMAEPVKNKCQDVEYKAWFNEHGQMVIPVAGELNQYILALEKEINETSYQLVNPNSLKSEDDPFVIALALMLEKRDLEDLTKNISNLCKVISYEKYRNKGAKYAKIPDVCSRYQLGHLNWMEFLRVENFDTKK